MMYYILFISEKEAPKRKSKGKGVASRSQKQASSKGKEAVDVQANKRKVDKTDDVSGRWLILTIFIHTDEYQQSSKRWNLPHLPNVSVFLHRG